jgi:hypothetical protein
VQVDHDQIVFALDELQQVNVTVYSVALHVELVNILDSFDGGYLPNEIVLCNEALDPMHVLKVVEALELIARDVNCGHVSQVLADVLRHRFDLIVGKVEYLDSFWQHPELLNFIVAQVQILQEVERVELFDFLKHVAGEVELSQILEQLDLRYLCHFPVHKSECQKLLWIFNI